MNNIARNGIFYHIYPLGMCGAPAHGGENPGERLSVISQQVERIAQMGFNAVYMGPVFESDAHGYDTVDYRTIDRRLGTNESFAALCRKFHENGISVVLDGVFNHVGRGFWAFRDVQQRKWDSPYAGWFNISFDGNTGYNDGFWYEGWEGHYELVKLNLRNRDVVNYLLETVGQWIELFDIDGLRLDVAYCLDLDFMRELSSYCRAKKPGFFLLGEAVHGDYNRLLDTGLDSVTNYECYKGLHSSVTSVNMHEIAYSLNRQFGREHWCLYTGRPLYTFLENHDVSRIASIIPDEGKLRALYALMFAMPGLPSVYYGGEFALKADKAQGDPALRPALTAQDAAALPTELAEYISRLCKARENCAALCCGSYEQIAVGPAHLAFRRACDGSTAVCVVNISDNPVTVGAGIPECTDLVSGAKLSAGDITAAPRSTVIAAW